MAFLKQVFRSNTIQFNSVLTSIWALAMQSEFVLENPAVMGWLGVFQTIGNLLLRAKTTKPLSQR